MVIFAIKYTKKSRKMKKKTASGDKSNKLTNRYIFL